VLGTTRAEARRGKLNVIVVEALATAFEMGRDEEGNALNRTHRRRYLLSGLLICSCCGAG